MTEKPQPAPPAPGMPGYVPTVPKPSHLPTGGFAPGNKCNVMNAEPRRFETAEELQAAFDAYMQHLADNPLQEQLVFSAKEGIRKTYGNKMRAPTWQGFAVFLKTSARRIQAWRTERADLKETLDRIGDIMFAAKFEGAAAGLLNAGIISRDLELVEKQSVALAATVAAAPPLRSLANCVHPDDPDPLGENRPLFTQEQIDAGIPFFEPKR